MSDLSSALEAILFAAGESVPIARLSLVLGMDENIIDIKKLMFMFHLSSLLINPTGLPLLWQLLKGLHFFALLCPGRSKLFSYHLESRV